MGKLIGRMGDLFFVIYKQPLKRIVFLMIVIVLLWGYFGKVFRGKIWWRVFNAIIFTGTVGVIFYTTVYSRTKTVGQMILIPFYSFVEAGIQPEMYRSMLMNVFLFVPVGLSLPFVLSKRKHPVLVTVIIACLFSVSIEAMQYCFSLGLCETDDVIMNTLGVAIGVLGYMISGVRSATDEHYEQNL